MQIVEQLIEQAPIRVTTLEAWIDFDNLKDFAKIKWRLRNSAGSVVREGSVGIEGPAYLLWIGDNATAQRLAAANAGVELVPEPEPVIVPEEPAGLEDPETANSEPAGEPTTPAEPTP